MDNTETEAEIRIFFDNLPPEVFEYLDSLAKHDGPDDQWHEKPRETELTRNCRSFYEWW